MTITTITAQVNDLLELTWLDEGGEDEKGAPKRPFLLFAGAYWLPKMAGGRVVSPPVFGKSGYL